MVKIIILTRNDGSSTFGIVYMYRFCVPRKKIDKEKYMLRKQKEVNIFKLNIAE